MMKTVGVLALQGDFTAHIQILQRCEKNIEIVEVRDKSTLERCDALLIPGGESTTMSRLCDRFQLWQPINQKITNGMPVFGTCAGLIMLAKKISGATGNFQQQTFKALDVSVERNAYGRQIDSFETTLEAPKVSASPIQVLFIRAPLITRVGNEVEILAEFNNSPVAVKQHQIVAASFHPEITGNIDFHRYWLEQFV